MKRGDIVIAVGYLITKKKDGNKKDEKIWPDFLEKGTHRISITRDTSFGTLVKTDRHPSWLNSKWFRIGD